MTGATDEYAAWEHSRSQGGLLARGLPVSRRPRNAGVDVRDLARMMTKVIDQGPKRGARRYMAGGHFVSWAEEADIVERITGRRVRRLPVPAWLLRLAARMVDFIKWVYPPFDYPLTREAAEYVVRPIAFTRSRTSVPYWRYSPIPSWSSPAFRFL